LHDARDVHDGAEELAVEVAMSTFLRFFALLLFCCTPMQGAQAPADPLVASVHVAPYRPSINVTVNLSHQRLDMRNATIINMIDFAHGRPDDDGREDSAIAGGPTWIDLERYDMVAIVPDAKRANPKDGQPPVHEDPYEKSRLIVERILAGRFHLKYHMEEQPLPGFAITISKDGTKLSEAEHPDDPGNCQSGQDKSNAGQMLIICTSATIAQFVQVFSDVFRHPLLDQTGLQKTYDFTLRLSSDQMQTREDSIHAYIDACGKQLGLVIAAANVPQPAIVVDSLERPTPDSPQVAKLVASLPELEFEVASIRPAADNEPQSKIRPAGAQIAFTNFSMQELMTLAWQLPTGAMLGNVPAWLGSTRYTVLVKLPPEIDARAVLQDQDQLDHMLQKLLVQRFGIQYHWGQQTQDGFVLLPGTAKLKKADPNGRSYCKYGPAEGEKDVRRAGTAFNGEFHCQNVTMDQFADLAQAMAKSEIKNRVVNKTGLAGSYDFTLYYTTSRKMRQDAQAAIERGGDEADPVGGLSIQDAFRKELGLRLGKRSGVYPALILDHIDQTPTEN